MIFRWPRRCWPARRPSPAGCARRIPARRGGASAARLRRAAPSPCSPGAASRRSRAHAISVRREPLGWLSGGEARREGFASAEAFERAFTALAGAYNPAALVWRVEFELVAKVHR